MTIKDFQQAKRLLTPTITPTIAVGEPGREDLRLILSWRGEVTELATLDEVKEFINQL